jgi:hypothetical protein
MLSFPHQPPKIYPHFQTAFSPHFHTGANIQRGMWTKTLSRSSLIPGRMPIADCAGAEVGLSIQHIHKSTVTTQSSTDSCLQVLD